MAALAQYQVPITRKNAGPFLKTAFGVKSLDRATKTLLSEAPLESIQEYVKACLDRKHIITNNPDDFSLDRKKANIRSKLADITRLIRYTPIALSNEAHLSCAQIIARKIQTLSPEKKDSSCRSYLYSWYCSKVLLRRYSHTLNNLRSFLLDLDILLFIYYPPKIELLINK